MADHDIRNDDRRQADDEWQPRHRLVAQAGIDIARSDDAAVKNCRSKKHAIRNEDPSVPSDDVDV